MDEEQHHEAERELPAPEQAVGGDRDERGAGGARILIFGSSSRTALSFANSATSAAPAAPSFSRSRERRGVPKASAGGRRHRRAPPATGGSSGPTGGVSIAHQVWQAQVVGRLKIGFLAENAD